MQDEININHLQLLRFRKEGFSKSNILSAFEERSLQRYLQSGLGKNVFVISTPISLDIYYLAPEPRQHFVKNGLEVIGIPEAKVRQLIAAGEKQGNEVLTYFNTVVNALREHPQLFLKCCKKLSQKFNEDPHPGSLVRLLYSYYDILVERLLQKNELPHAEKITALRLRPEYNTLAQSNTRSLAKRWLGTLHHN
ncbi:hypothetical protein [Croceiramulus getboli]|nr:hypothetical protein P8624_05930 [Flavobacteriaceae bacterium YJPT1-3]